MLFLTTRKQIINKLECKDVYAFHVIRVKWHLVFVVWNYDSKVIALRIKKLNFLVRCVLCTGLSQ